MTNYPKRLIEVDLPINRISTHARREKSIRHGHISTLHIWWARRPLAACRAVICASLWPDPADPLCPPEFRQAAATQMIAFAQAVHENTDLTNICDGESWKRYGTLAKENRLDLNKPEALLRLRNLLLDFIADFAAWEASTQKVFLATARALTQAAHESLGGAPGTRPLVVDPFAGGGSIPLEALRVGADAFASDLNPVAVLLNKVVLEYIPKYGQQLADEVRKWGQWVKERAEKELAQYYPKDPDGATPIAYLWARTIQCEGPNCGLIVPLLGLLNVSRREGARYALAYGIGDHKISVGVKKYTDESEIQPPIVKKFAATCPRCGYTTPYARVRSQISLRHGGTSEALLTAVVLETPNGKRRVRPATDTDHQPVQKSSQYPFLSATPSTATPDCRGPGASRAFSLRRWGFSKWRDVFTVRQSVSFLKLADILEAASVVMEADGIDLELRRACIACLSLAVSNVTHYASSLSIWAQDHMISSFIQGTGLAMRPDFAESNLLVPRLVGGIDYSIEQVCRTLEAAGNFWHNSGRIENSGAQKSSLPDDSAAAFVTDPPYYDQIPYSGLSELCFVWLRLMLGRSQPGLTANGRVPTAAEIVEDPGPRDDGAKNKDASFFRRAIQDAMEEGHRVVDASGIAVVVFAHKETTGWEALLSGLVDAGWIVTASWPIDTEKGSRLRAQKSAALASSVHLVCRPRANGITATIGDWRTVLQELPPRIHAWMPRLAEEGVVGADAIFACLGPALEIFSRFARVEKANGEKVTLREYLQHVWAAVAQEALKMVFAGADAGALEEDARLTAIWLWTLGANAKDVAQNGGPDDDADDEQGPESGDTAKPVAGKAGYTLEYDAARKIAQGLGANLEQLADVVEIKGDKARLLDVFERTRTLFGKDQSAAPAKARKKARQGSFFQTIDEIESQDGGWGNKSVPKLGTTVLDRVHQSMILFAAARGEALKRFLVEEGAGGDARFWKLAQALSALYPTGTDEKRWVDGVLARKKGLGL